MIQDDLNCDDWEANIEAVGNEAAKLGAVFTQSHAPFNKNLFLYGKQPDEEYLAGFDQLMLGYEKKESLFLKPEHMRAVFNLAGIVMPPLMLRGNVVGKWKKKNRLLTVELFDNVSHDDVTLIKEKAKSLWDDIGRIEWK